MAPTRKLAELFYDLRARTEGLEKDVAQAERSFGKLTAFVNRNPVAAVAAVGTALAGVAVQATRMALEVERSMLRVQQATGGGTAALKSLRTEITALSIATGRSQAELAAAAAEAARSASSTEEVGERLKAALDLSQATGEDLTAVLQSLDQVLDVFALSSADAGKALATLFAAAKGRQPISDLFSSIESAGPAINRLGLDIDVVARALVALGDRGLNAKKAATELEKLSQAGARGREEVVRLANEIQPAVNAMGEFREAVDLANNSTDSLNGRLKAEFSANIIRLGDVLLPKVNFVLRSIAETMEILAGRAGPIEAQSLLSTIINLGPHIERLDEQGKRGAKGLRDLEQAAQDLRKALLAGELKIKDLGIEELERLQVALESMVDSSRISQTTRQFLEPLLAAVEKLIAEAPRAAEAVASIGRTAPRSGLPSDRIKGETEAAKRLKEQEKLLEELQQAFGDLFEKAAEGRVAFDEFDRSVRDLAERFQRELPAATQEQVAAFQELLVQARSLRDGLKEIKAGEVSAELDALFAAMTTTAVDDLEVALAQLKKQLDSPFVDPARAAELIEASEALIELTKRFEENRKKQAEAAEDAFEIGELQVQIKELEEEFAKLAGKGVAFDTARRAILEEIERILQRIAELRDEDSKRAVVLTRETSKWAGQLSEVASVAFGIATALRGADDNITRAIGSTAQLLASLQQVSDTIAQAGSLAKALASPGSFFGVLAGIGGVVGSLGALFSGRKDPEEDRAREEQLAAQQELVHALDRVRDSIGDLARFGSAGGDIASVRNVELTRRTRTGGFSGLEEIDFFRPIDDILADLRKLGVGLDDLRAIAQDAGITLSDSPTIAELQNLQAVLREIDFNAFLNTFRGQLSRLEHEFELFGDLFDEPAERFKAFVELLNDPDVGAPALFGAFEGLDTATQEGRDAIRALIQDLFTQAASGDIDVDLLGGLSLDEFLAALLRLNEELNATGDGVDDLTDDIAQLRETIFRTVRRDIALRDIEDPTAAVGLLSDATKEAFPGLTEFLSQFDFATIEGLQDFGGSVADFIAGIEDGSIVIEGVAAEDIPALVDSLVQLEQAGDAAENAILSLADQLVNAFRSIDFDAVIFGQSDVDRLNKKFEEVGLGAFDLTTQAGRESARDALRALAQTDPTLKPLIAQLIQDLDRLPEIPRAVGDAIASALGDGERSSISTAARSLTEVTGNRMADYLATLVLLARQRVELLRSIAGVGIAPSALLQPPALATTSTTNVQGGLTLVIADGAIRVQAPLGVTDPGAFGQAILDRLVPQIEQRLASNEIQRRRLSGNVGVS